MCWHSVVLPDDSGPKISVTRPRGTPPPPSARSSASDPVGIVSTARCVASPSLITAPSPYCFLICETADSRARFRSSGIERPREYVELSDESMRGRKTGQEQPRSKGPPTVPLPLRENLPPPAQDHHAPCNCMPGEGQGGGESAAVAAIPDQGQTSSALQGCQTLERTSLASLGIESEDSHAGGPLRSASGGYARIEAGNNRSGRT